MTVLQSIGLERNCSVRQASYWRPGHRLTPHTTTVTDRSVGQGGMVMYANLMPLPAFDGAGQLERLSTSHLDEHR